MPLRDFNQLAQPAIDAAMQRIVNHPLVNQYAGLPDMLRYHLGWDGPVNGPEAQGKRIRPLLVLLTAEACGGAWQPALPAAAAVELLHNFSLIHDDIEDNSPLRRGRETVWKKWGIPLAINAGDALYTLAFESIHQLAETCSAQVVNQATKLLIDTCLRLTGGQHLDISYENERTISLDWYWKMTEGKTAALLSACLQLGGIVCSASPETIEALKRFGFSLGLSFQIQDDWLGIWGDSALTGKSTESDLVNGKKTLPVVYALQKRGAFAKRWLTGNIEPGEASLLAAWLVEEGAQAYTEQQATIYTQQALSALEQTGLTNHAGAALRELALLLLHRNS
ncbi:MAG: polyprenyl synthetase family protein [Bellilinea sp.]|jgi:geranylgeranyl diphosphate synthase type I